MMKGREKKKDVNSSPLPPFPCTILSAAETVLVDKCSDSRITSFQSGYNTPVSAQSTPEPHKTQETGDFRESES